MTFHTGVKNTNPTTMPAARARAILRTRLRSSLMWSISGMRPSGLCRCWVRTKCPPTMRAPWMASPSFAMAPPLVATGVGYLAGLLGAGGVGRDGVHCGGPLQVTDLLLKRVDLRLLLRLRHGHRGLRDRTGR